MLFRSQSQSFGEHLAIGDLTGDGVADLVVSAPWAAVEKVPNKGRIFLFAGPLDAETTLASAVGTFEGGDLAGQPGTTLGILPDVTGDGVAELVVGYYRFVLLFSGLPLGAGTADAFASLEMNTGGGLWTFSTAPDADGDGLAELVLGMPSYAGTGFVGQWNSGRLTGTLGAADRTWVGTAAALGGALARVGDTVWTLAGSSPVPLTADGVGTALDVEATTLAAADIDGDGVDELLSGGDAIVAVDRGTWPFAGALVADPVDIDGDGADDPAVLRDGEALILEGARAFTDGCDADGDGVSLEIGRAHV